MTTLPTPHYRVEIPVYTKDYSTQRYIMKSIEGVQYTKHNFQYILLKLLDECYSRNSESASRFPQAATDVRRMYPIDYSALANYIQALRPGYDIV